jgi:hypothetical protein
MKTKAHLLQYLAEFVKEWDMLQKKIVDEIKHTYFVFSNIFPKILPFMRYVEKIIESYRPQIPHETARGL